MSRNPYLHAILAAIYIATVVFVMNAISSLRVEDEILMPMAALGIFVLSAAAMGYLFIASPLQLYLDGKKVQSVTFFAKTVGTFAIFLLIYIAALFYFSL